ncbi:MAG: peptidoglycan DD-metalloendopeptidase family protein, partial [Glaciimonas sp.]|nr:peptidoglycan DD-metalloendopeptidase family protein [Glaciimonas sp.]
MKINIKIYRYIVIVMIAGALAACSTPGSSPSANAPSGPGYYTVQKGDTLYSIGRKYRQSPRDIAAWSKLIDMNGIEIGQVLRVQPEGGVRTRAATSSGTSAAPNKPAAPVQRNRPSVTPSPTLVAGEEQRIDWTWPAQGRQTQNKKGIDILGSLGQPIVAAATGKVMYAGSGIRGYGNLVIVKHTTNILSVYAHNKVILVKEGQAVSKGQK